ncbi:hypothetical protein [Alkalimarinus coralli]|uniref:hypothetical protein n=1 Tax=Alkalimarinus coralli TaxID=2935863 RepID=UPI00202ACE6A|nr:hypothetical protein [Alkalimarinus coralli]
MITLALPFRKQFRSWIPLFGGMTVAEEGEKSGTAEYSYESLMNELDDELG